MPELKGLLDAARGRIRGLLGDFPQGFNAGSVAGVAGYPGDIAYMLDTAGRALTGQDTMPAAQDFPGTTDYLAAKAGYPIPQSFSGQLGAAVGGLMTPGPGDLARFAPVLAAIPFWHGSPHKYDAVDLSKIGTGEGAQAYGWGYYGADSKDVATEYARQNGGKAAAKDGLIDSLPPPVQMSVYHLMNMPDGRIGKNESVADLIASYPEYADEIRGAIESKKPNLYRGEYVWPDPAKEAATPLTGEDLLDWDRPLSEQSEKVKRAILDAGTPGKWGTGSSGERRFLNAPDYHTPSGEAAYKRLSEIFGSDKAATDYLNSLGIPGIRYKDQMSRGSEGGTYNYVFFNEKGINLLERNGEPINAAQDFAARRAGKAKPYKEATGQI